MDYEDIARFIILGDFTCGNPSEKAALALNYDPGYDGTLIFQMMQNHYWKIKRVTSAKIGTSIYPQLTKELFLLMVRIMVKIFIVRGATSFQVKDTLSTLIEVDSSQNNQR